MVGSPRPRASADARGPIGDIQSRKAPLGDAVQQLPLPAVPPASAHRSPVVTLQVVTGQSASVVQGAAGSPSHSPSWQAPVVVTTQVTPFLLPQLDCAAQATRSLTQRRFTPADRAARFTAWATHRT